MFSKNFFKFYTIGIFILLCGFCFVVAAGAVYAQGSVLEDVNSANPNCISSGNCELNDFMRVATGVAKLILGLTGSLALVAFVYGGVLMLISGGSSEKVNQAKQIIFGAVVGLVIVFASYTIIGFIFKSLGIGGEWFRIGGIWGT